MRIWSSGDTIGEYRLERLLGSGGAGMVYLAKHVRLGHAVVIKLLRPEVNSPEQRGRFLREGQALGRLHHAGIVGLLHADKLADGTEYLVLEHVDGVSLRQLIASQEGPLPTGEVAHVLAQVASALAYAHAQGVLHRDVKPENLLVCRGAVDPEGRRTTRVVLIDFGLACFAAPTDRATLPWPDGLTQLDTQPGARPGTPFYRAPELGMDLLHSDDDSKDARHSPALDAYALGVVGWELLTGQRPNRLQPSDALGQLRALRPDSPPELTSLVAALVSLSPHARPNLDQVANVCTVLASRVALGRSAANTRGPSVFRKIAQTLRGSHLSIQMTAVVLTSLACVLFFGMRRFSMPLPLLRPSVPDVAKRSDLPLLVIAQPTLGIVNDEEIASALGPRQAVVQRVDIAPMQQLGSKLDLPDWPQLAERQTELVRTLVMPALRTAPTPRIAYFGMAPVPLGIHLGALLSGLVPVSVYQRSHRNGSWKWPDDERTQDVVRKGLPQVARQDVGSVVLRVSSSVPIDPNLTREVVTNPLAEIDLTLRVPSPDALRSETDVIEVAAAVQQTLDEIAKYLPHATVVHLFAAVPGALALRIGMAINPNIHPPIQTYHFDRNLSPRYRPALLLNAGHNSPRNGEESMPSNAATLIERRLETFVDWLKPDPEAESAMAQRAHEIRDKIRAQAAADKLTVRLTPGAGSFAKNTGLRRHVTGGSSVDGQDVDIPFVLAPMTEQEQRISRLLDRFQGYADRAYPQTPPNKSRTKSSIKIVFEGSKLSFDLVPMIQAVEYGEDYQWLLRGDGTKRLTSVDRHNTFIKKRTNDSNQRPGRVKFNECVRLLKWWREFRMANDRRSIPGMPSILLEMLAAYAFDHKGVQATYSETLLSWFEFLNGTVSQRKRIGFNDYPPPRGRRHAEKTPWMVIEPVDPENNLTHDWIDQHIDELAGWFQRGRDDMQRAIDLDRKNNPQESLHHLVRIFGTPFKHHCGD